jgi:hypothetical protein
VYLDVVYADETLNYKAGGIIFREYGGRRTNLLEIKNCIDQTEELNAKKSIRSCVETHYPANLDSLPTATRMNLFHFIEMNMKTGHF